MTWTHTVTTAQMVEIRVVRGTMVILTYGGAALWLKPGRGSACLDQVQINWLQSMVMRQIMIPVKCQWSGIGTIFRYSRSGAVEGVL